MLIPRLLSPLCLPISPRGLLDFALLYLYSFITQDRKWMQIILVYDWCMTPIKWGYLYHENQIEAPLNLWNQRLYLLGYLWSYLWGYLLSWGYLRSYLWGYLLSRGYLRSYLFYIVFAQNYLFDITFVQSYPFRITSEKSYLKKITPKITPR